MIYILGILLIFIGILLVKTINFSKDGEIYEVIYDKTLVDKDDVLKKLQKAIKIKTISNSDYSKTDFREFKNFIDLLEANFPKIHKQMERTIVNDYSLVFKWQGKNQDKKPGMIMAHIDVVPIEEGTLKDWEEDPFSGAIKDGYIYGRGTMDIKIHLITVMQACENLIKEGFVPERDLYLCFGHDEEVGGQEGAAKIVEYFKKKKIKFDYVLDEGGVVSSGVISSVKKPIALIGVAEKGYCNLKINIKAEGGHASTPPKNTSLGLVSKVICALEEKKIKMHLPEATKTMIKALALHMNFMNRLIIANLWIFKGIFIKSFGKSGTNGEALLRTTIAPTMAHASMEPNVLPQVSSFTVNCRILQEYSGSKLLSHIKKQCKNLNYNIDILRLDEPSQVSDSKSEIFRTISGVILGIYEDVAIIPYLMVAGTDSYKFECISDNVFRFTPYYIEKDDIKRVHGTNERNSIENVVNCVRFFTTLIKNY